MKHPLYFRLAWIFLILLSTIEGKTQGFFMLTPETDSLGRVLLIGKNKLAGPISVILNCNIYDGIANKSLPDTEVIAANSEVRMLEISPDKEKTPVWLDFRYVITMGDYLNSAHNDSVIYLLPFKSRKCVRILQSYNGDLSHKEQNALDFDLNLGTPVLASRSGKVIYVKQDSKNGCPDQKCAGMANMIIVLHNDGTLGRYAHLKFGSALISVGQEITAGFPIAQSGNTGQSNRPHLHFDVLLPRFTNQAGVTIATSFQLGNQVAYISGLNCIKSP